MSYYAAGLPEAEQNDIENYIDSKEGKDESLSESWKKNSHNLVYRGLTILHETLEKDLSACTNADIFKVMGVIKKNTKYSKNYKRLLVHGFRAFLLWYAKQYGTLTGSEIADIKLPEKQWKTKKAKDMLSKQEIEELLLHCRNTRDRCLVAMLWDGSNRSIELLSLTWETLIQDEDGYYFSTNAKTGKERHIRLTMSIPYIDEWKRQYPGETKGSNPVFCTVNKVKGGLKPLSKDNLDRIILYLKKITGNQKLKPSIFRPSRITSDVVDGFDLQYVMKKNWGHLRTSMIDLYTNTDEEYIDQMALRKAGMDRGKRDKETEVYKMEPPICPSCGTLNVLGAQFCSKCITPLSEEAKTRKEFVVTELQGAQLDIMKDFERRMELMEDQNRKLAAALAVQQK